MSFWLHTNAEHRNSSEPTYTYIRAHTQTHIYTPIHLPTLLMPEKWVNRCLCICVYSCINLSNSHKCTGVRFVCECISKWAWESLIKYTLKKDLTFFILSKCRQFLISNLSSSFRFRLKSHFIKIAKYFLNTEHLSETSMYYSYTARIQRHIVPACKSTIVTQSQALGLYYTLNTRMTLVIIYKSIQMITTMIFDH